MKITRTITESRIYVSAVTVENGEVKIQPLPSFVVTGLKVTKENAMKFAKVQFGKNNNIIVTNVEVRFVKFSMDLEYFLEHAEQIESSEARSLLMRNVEGSTPFPEFTAEDDFNPTEE